jgi:two-component system CheB/CheR fusion protein
LSERSPEQGLWLPIDAFFRSMADELGARAIGVVLSGTGSDGSRGLRAIHAAGGLAIAQDPSTARFDGMPRSAIDTGVVDLVLAPGRVGEAVARYAERTEREDLSAMDPEESQGLAGVFEVLERDTGVDFAVYKGNTIGRRLERRLLMTGAPSVEDYLQVLRDSAEEREALYRDLLIGVTSFFRDPDAFAALEHEVLPELVRGLAEGEPLRVWVAACATGEEAYSVAIAAFETFRRLGRAPRVRLFATDVHRGSLEIASAGVYDDASLLEMDPERKDRYFVREGSRWKVTEALRNAVVFAYHNVLRDAPFTKLDLVSCRNLLIYFDASAQGRVLSLFHFALKTSGVLFLGPSETPGVLADELSPVDRRWKIYRKRRELRLPAELRSVTQLRPFHRHNPTRSEDVIERARTALLERFAPPSLVVSPEHTLIHSSGGASRYLTHREGAPSLQLLDLVSGELKYALAGALKRVREGTPSTVVRYDGVPVETADGPVRLTVTISRIGAESDPYLITLEPQRPTLSDRAIDAPLDALARERIDGLEVELRYAKENLQATIEEMEASNEELQATNEELIASNEELHSANEELQSVNEELYTVNAEHQQKIAELQQLTNDMEHLFQATDVHTVFLDQQLRIRKFTPKMGETFRLIDTDQGRSIDTFAHRLRYPGLYEDLRTVLTRGERLEREVDDLDRHNYLMRILPYRPHERVEGVVLTLIDISGVRRTERRLEERESELAAILEHSPAPLYARAADGRLLLAGRVAREIFALEDARLTADEEAVIEHGEPIAREEQHVVDGALRTFLAVHFPLRTQDTVTGVLGVATDITDRKLREDQQREAVEQRDRFLAMLSHELRNPLAAIASAANVILETSPGDPARRVATTLARQARHIKSLLDDLLDVTRITLDRLSITKAPVDLRDVITRSVEALEAWARTHHVKLELPSPCPSCTVEGDATRLQQTLTNLLTNAVKFSSPGSSVRVELDVADGKAVVRVVDYGIGLAPEELDRVFELFYQEPQEIDRPMGGLGVGLSLARAIVEGHGGSLRAISAGRGQGATFEVVLPQSDREPIRVPDESPQPAAKIDPLHVLLVEDQDDNRDMLSLFVSMRGHEPLTAADGEEAIAKVLRERPDLALVDIGLPGIDGYEVARRVRALDDGPRPYLVALTGYGRPEDRAAAAEAGFDEHLVKPLTRDELERVLAAAAMHRAARDGRRTGAPSNGAASRSE